MLKDSLGDSESDRVLTSLEERGEERESLALDATQNCPCCTLPLEAKVLRVSVIAFPCGKQGSDPKEREESVLSKV